MTKIAICFHGNISSFPSYSKNYIENKNTKNSRLSPFISESINSFKKNILNKNNNVDIFIHSWNPEYKNSLINELNPIKSIFEISGSYNLPNKKDLLFFFLKNAISMNPVKFLKNIIQLKNNWSKKSNLNRIYGIFNRWNSVSNVLKLISKYEIENSFKYDFIFLTRFDLFYLEPIIFSKYDNKVFNFPSNPDLVDHHNNRVPLNLYYKLKKEGHNIRKISNDKKMQNVLDDLFFFSSSDNMMLVSDLFENICNYFNEGIQLSNHYLLHHHLKKKKKINDIKFSVERIFEIDLARRYLEISTD